MASNATKMIEVNFLENNLKFVERLLYDVLAYTLPICGLTETNMLTTDYGENTYEYPNFIESIGAAVLTKSLAVRNAWSKPMWVAILSQKDSCEINYEYIVLFLKATFHSFHKKKVPVTKNFVLEMSLAFCNEISLFAHHERRDIDVNKLVKSVSKFIVGAIAPDQNVADVAGELFPESDNIPPYTKWITDFITKFAVPYGSRDDVPELFKQHFKKLWEGEYKGPTWPDIPLLINLKNPDRFLTSQLLKDTTAEDSATFPESSVLKSDLTDDCETPGSSESNALEARKSIGEPVTRVANVSDQSGQSKKESLEWRIEDDLGQLSLSAIVACQDSHGTIQKRKMPEH